MARIRPAKGQTSDQTGPAGAPPPGGRKKPPSDTGKRTARPRPTQQGRKEKSGSVTKSVQDNRASRFLSEVTAELRKVSWPTRSQLLQATAVVLIFVAIVAVYLSVVDAAMSRLVEAIF
ncbi:MAG: preprotein translocase subunit SecE [Thermoleophilia bacterium]|jgi:preprotein translocase subunit SecE|nr:preprotein translocase subunit SecE [Thermoleophilia bacterium]